MAGTTTVTPDPKDKKPSGDTTKIRRLEARIEEIETEKEVLAKQLKRTKIEDYEAEESSAKALKKAKADLVDAEEAAAKQAKRAKEATEEAVEEATRKAKADLTAAQARETAATTWATEAERANAEAQKTIERINEQLRQQTDETRRYKEAYEALRVEFGNCQTTGQQLARDLEAARRNADSKERELQQARVDMDQARRTIGEFEEQLRRSKSVADEAEQLRKQLQGAQDELRTMKDQVKDLERDARDVQRDYDRSLTDYRKMEDRAVKAEQELATVRGQLTGKDAENANLRIQLANAAQGRGGKDDRGFLESLFKG